MSGENAREAEKIPKNNKKKTSTRSVIEQFDESLINHPENARVAIFAHRTPDPDAIGAMMGLRWFIHRKYGLDSDLFCDGSIAHPQNSVMCNLLDPGMFAVSDYDPQNYTFRILVDTIPENAGDGGKKVDFDLVIDHHRDLPHDYDGMLIHMKVGSASAIVYHVIKKLLAKESWFDDDIDGDAKVATALIAGVMTDTNYLLSDDSTEIDREAFSDLFEYRNSAFLHQIVFFKRPKFWIDKKAFACTEASVDKEGYAIVGLGVIPGKERDLIADMADEMVQWASVETAIAFAVVDGNRIEGSVRSVNASLTVSDFCKKLGEVYNSNDGNPLGTGGGKYGKGAYRIALSPDIDIDDSEEEIMEVWLSIRKREIKRINKIIKS